VITLPKAGMDQECVALCDAMNHLPGIETFESCCGHGKDNYRIWFMTEGLENLPALLYWFDGCHSGFYGWCVKVRTDCGQSPAHFCVEGPVNAHAEAERIAALIEAA